MRKIAVILALLMMLLVLFGCRDVEPKTYLNMSIPGEYDIEMSYSAEVDPGMTITVLLDTIEVLEEGSLKANMVWTSEVVFRPMFVIKKGSDQGNTDMFLKDDLGNKYHHVAGDGATYKEELLADGQTVSGAFYFPPVSASAKYITFYDLDVRKSMGPIGIQR